MSRIRFLLSLRALFATAALLNWGGCAGIARWVGDTGDPRQGITFYVGGAGPLGHVGSYDVPQGLQEAGYRGRVEVFTWQGVSHARDQIDIKNNRRTAVGLREKIRAYMRAYPGRPINLIALSAGTGIATFALETMLEREQVENVVFLGCSMSSGYDLTRALKRINGRLYVVYSPHDSILRNIVAYTGSVDRSSLAEGIAGLVGFRPPDRPGPDTEAQYAKLRNIPYSAEFAGAGYNGGHIDSTARAFIRDYVASAVIGRERSRLEAAVDAERSATSRRTTTTSRPIEAPSITVP